MKKSLIRRPEQPFQVGTKIVSLEEITRECASILGSHPDVRLVTLFGSYARGCPRQGSDIDLLIWLGPDAQATRRDIWDFWDGNSTYLQWSRDASLIVKRLSPSIQLDTLLLDFPEEHLSVFDAADYHSRIAAAVEGWRKQNGSYKIPSFGGTHAWKYTDRAVRLQDLDFSLQVGDVA